jgi:hypothetical protein
MFDGMEWCGEVLGMRVEMDPGSETGGYARVLLL